MINLSTEETTAVLTLLSFAVASTAFLWRIFKVSRVFLNDHELLKTSIKKIESEVTANGGKSLKDVVNQLKTASLRIETRQKVLDQRSKATLHYSDRPLFEIDSQGRLIWSNESFINFTRDNGSVKEGFDWITVISDDERETFLIEFQSCLDMCRKIDIETVSVHGRDIHFVGYPYRIDQGIHEGFLIHLYQENKHD